MYCLRDITFRAKVTTHDLCIIDEKTKKSADLKGQRHLGMTYSSLIYKTTQLCGLLRVEPHPRSCIAKLQVLRKRSSNDQGLEGLKGVKLLFQRGEKDLKSGKKVFKIMNDKEVGLQASVLAKIQNQLNCKAEKLRLDERNTFQFRTCGKHCSRMPLI